MNHQGQSLRQSSQSYSSARGNELTPTQREQYARHIRFKASIAEKARSLAESRKAKSIEPEPLTEPPAGKIPFAGEIIEVVAKHYGVKASDIVSDRRTSNIIMPRQVAMYLTKELTPKSYPIIGRSFRRDHTNIIYAVNKIEVRRAHDPDLDFDLNVLTAKVWQAVSART